MADQPRKHIEYVFVCLLQATVIASFIIHPYHGKDSQMNRVHVSKVTLFGRLKNSIETEKTRKPQPFLADSTTASDYSHHHLHREEEENDFLGNKAGSVKKPILSFLSTKLKDKENDSSLSITYPSGFLASLQKPTAKFTSPDPSSADPDTKPENIKRKTKETTMEIWSETLPLFFDFKADAESYQYEREYLSFIRKVVGKVEYFKTKY